MPAYNSLRTKKEFGLIYKKGKALHGMFFSLHFLKSKNSDGANKFGIVLGLNISKSSVVRNKKRRQLKEIIRLNQGKIKSGHWIILSAKDKILGADYEEMEKEFLGLCKKAEILKISKL